MILITLLVSQAFSGPIHELFPEKAHELSVLGMALSEPKVRLALGVNTDLCLGDFAGGELFAGKSCPKEFIDKWIIPMLDKEPIKEIISKAEQIKSEFGKDWIPSRLRSLYQLLLLNLKGMIDDDTLFKNLVQEPAFRPLLDALLGVGKLASLIPELAPQRLDHAIKRVIVGSINANYYTHFANAVGEILPVYHPGPGNSWHGGHIDEMQHYEGGWRVVYSMPITCANPQRQWLEERILSQFKFGVLTAASLLSKKLSPQAMEQIVSVARVEPRLRCPFARLIMNGNLYLESAFQRGFQLQLYRILVSADDIMPVDPAMPLAKAILECRHPLTETELERFKAVSKYYGEVKKVQRLKDTSPVILAKIEQLPDLTGIEVLKVPNLLDSQETTVPELKIPGLTEAIEQLNSLQMGLDRVLILGLLETHLPIEAPDCRQAATLFISSNAHFNQDDFWLLDSKGRNYEAMAAWWFNQPAGVHAEVRKLFDEHPLLERIPKRVFRDPFIPMIPNRESLIRMVVDDRLLILRTILYLSGMLSREVLLAQADMNHFRLDLPFVLNWFGDAIMGAAPALGNAYEGGQAVNADRFMIKMLVELKRNRPTFCPLSPEQIDNLLEQFLIHHLNSFIAVDRANEQSDMQLDGFISQLLQQRTGPTLLSGNTGIHAFTVHVENNKVTLLNSGEGVSRHDQIRMEDGTVRYRYYVQETLTTSEIAQRGFYVSRLRGQESAGHFFLGNRQPAQLNSTKDTVGSQKSGTCWVKNVLYALKYLTRREHEEHTDESVFNWIKTWIFHHNYEDIQASLRQETSFSFNQYPKLAKSWTTKDEQLPAACKFGPISDITTATLRHNILKNLNIAHGYLKSMDSQERIEIGQDMIKMLDSLPKDPDLLVCYQQLKESRK